MSMFTSNLLSILAVLSLVQLYKCRPSCYKLLKSLNKLVVHIHGTELPEYITIMHGPVNVQHTKVALFVSIYVIQE